MTFPGALFVREWREMRRFNALEQSKRSLVFYAEDNATFVYYQPIINELTENMRREICYLTSSPDDPILSSKNKKIRAFYIGNGAVRINVFMGLKVDVMVMTMPDLGNFHIKKSKVHPVHYVYVFHSLVSTHTCDRKCAFDHYDTILCAGPHHVREIRAAESVYGLKATNLIEHGYGRLDMLIEERVRSEHKNMFKHSQKKYILVAPSYGENGLLETSTGSQLIKILVEAGYYVVIRPHPVTMKKASLAIKMLKEKFSTNFKVEFETDIRSIDSFYSSYCMISDWSGVALEYAFALERPVIFIDVPNKIRNPDYKDIPCDPLEIKIRHEIGEVVSPDCLHEIPQKIEQFYENIDSFRKKIEGIRSKTVFNIGNSGVVAAKAIVQIATQK